MRIESDQRHLRDRRHSLLLPARVAPRELLIEVGDSDGHGLRRGALELRIERRIDAETLREQLGFREVVEQMVLHHVHEVGRVAVPQSAGNDLQRGALGVARLLRA